MFNKAALIAFSFIAMVFGQQVGTLTPEVHPTLPWQTCTTAGGCTTVSSGAVVLDANWRWVHSTTSATNCYTGNTWDATLCPNPTTCAENCAVDGADYESTYGISTSGDALTLKFVTDNSNGKNVGSRVYLMASETEYEVFKLLNTEFTFTVDVSQLPCGLNGALYFSQMDGDGGVARFPSNKAGAQYGTGYCDSQCPQDIKFIDGTANSAGWTPDANNANAGTGSLGTCCNEMDVWEANSVSAAFTPHPCTVQGQTACTGTACGTENRYASVCDPDGCDYNSYRLGDKTFYGPDMTVDTTQPFTVVTQFITDTGTAEGNLSEIRRLYVQNGKVIQNSNVNVAGIPSTYDSITADYCTAEVAAFGDVPDFANKGGLPNMSKALGSGMVLVLSLWDDYSVNMLWLDSDYPTTSSPTAPGVARGTCATTSGSPPVVESTNANAQVIYSNIKFGEIGSTYTGSTTGGGTTSTPPKTTTTPPKTTTTPPKTTTTTSSAAGPTQTHYGQCGGMGYSGPTACAAGTTCQYSNPYYSQCL